MSTYDYIRANRKNYTTKMRHPQDAVISVKFIPKLIPKYNFFWDATCTLPYVDVVVNIN